MQKVVDGQNFKKNYYSQRRNNAIKHRKKKKRRLIIFYLILILSILLIGIFFIIHNFFKITHIEIMGSKKYTQDEIKKIANLNIGQNIFLYRSSTISNTLKSKLVYIDDAQVKKVLPGKILINIVDSKPKYWLKVNDKYLIVNNSMKILEINNTLPNELAEIKITDVSNQNIGNIILDDSNKLNILLTLDRVLDKHSLKGVIKIDVTTFSDIKLSYQDRILILLGNIEQIDYKIKFVKSIIVNNIDKNERGIIDAVNVGSTSKVYFSPYKEQLEESKESEIEDSQ